MPRRPNPDRVGLPLRPFLFTFDQLATLISVDEKHLRDRYIYYWGRSTGSRPHDRMLARNIAPEGEIPEWRVAEREVIRWLKSRGFYIYDAGWVIN